MQPRNLPAAEAELELPLGFADELVLGADVLLPVELGRWSCRVRL
jgi:hypothetical protein